MENLLLPESLPSCLSHFRTENTQISLCISFYIQDATEFIYIVFQTRHRGTAGASTYCRQLWEPVGTFSRDADICYHKCSYLASIYMMFQ